MFYQPKDGHGLPHNPFSAIISPRPIGWISTRSKDGTDNLAPYSFFNAAAYEPPQVMFASTSRKEDRHMSKDSVANIDETGVFCVNIVAYAMRDAMNKTSGALDKSTDEFTHAGIKRSECETIACSRVTDAPASLECKVTQIVQLKGETNFVVFGEVTGIHLNDKNIVDGIYDVTTYQPLARLGYKDYVRVDNLFSLARPDD